jgi:hypothetical protein
VEALQPGLIISFTTANELIMQALIDEPMHIHANEVPLNIVDLFKQCCSRSSLST